MPKPYVICHMMTTIEGRITSASGAEVLDDYFDLYTKTEDSMNGNAWMCGRVTMEMFASGEQGELPAASVDSKDDFVVTKSNRGYMVGVDTRGRLRWQKNTLKLTNIESEIPLIIIVTEQTPESYLAYLQSKQINYIFGGKERIDFKTVLEKLADLEVKTLLLEGGGIINGHMLEQGLIDEISLMITPIALNQSGAPTVFERATTLAQTTQFKLKSVEQIERDCIWIRYTK